MHVLEVFNKGETLACDFVLFLLLYFQPQMDGSRNILSEVAQHIVETSDYDNNPHIEHNANSTERNHASQRSHRLLNIVCFWMVGLCNGFGWTVMLSATYDILEEFSGVSV